MRRCLVVLLLLTCLQIPARAQSNISPSPNVVGGCPVPGASCIAGSKSSLGWTYLQEAGAGACTVGGTTCTITLTATTSGSVWEVFVNTGNTTGTPHIASVSGGGGTWNLCPSSECNRTDAGGTVDAAYNLTGAAGTTSVTVTLSANATTFYGAVFFEVMPPSGTAASYKKGGTSSTASCTSTCAGVAFTTTGTDVIYQLNNNGGSTQGSLSFSSPYITTIVANTVYLNTSTGSIAAPTFTQSPASTSQFSAIDMTSSGGTLNLVKPRYALANYTTASGVACSPTCAITVPSTGSGNLLFVHVATLTNSHISSVSGGGTWTIPSGANTCPITITGNNDTISCAYALSSSSGTTSISVTMSANATVGYAIYEVSRTSGSFVFDTQASSQIATCNARCSGQALTLSGSDDVIFQGFFNPGGAGSVTLYPQPFITGSSCSCGGFLVTNASSVVRMNTNDGSAPTWVTNQNIASTVEGIAFK